MVQLDTEIDLGRLWRWWSSQLMTFLPPAVKQLFAEMSGTLLAEFAGNQLTLTFLGGDEREHLGGFDCDDADAKQQLQALFARRVKLKEARVILRLPDEQGMARDIYVPRAALKNLRQVVGYEMDRYTPFAVDEVYFDLLPQPSDDAEGMLKFRLIVVPRERLDHAVMLLQQWALPPSIVVYAGEPGVAPTHPGYNLLPATLRHQPSKGPLRMMLASLTLACAMLAGVAVLPLWLQSHAITRLQEHAALVRAKARELGDVRQEIDALRQQAETIVRIKTQAPAMLEILEELSQLIEDDSWLNQFRYFNQGIVISGMSPAASALLSIIEESPRFSNARFDSPVVQDMRTKQERFQISAQVVGGQHELE